VQNKIPSCGNSALFVLCFDSTNTALVIKKLNHKKHSNSVSKYKIKEKIHGNNSFCSEKESGFVFAERYQCIRNKSNYFVSLQTATCTLF
jgi:hypothetical protein